MPDLAVSDDLRGPVFKPDLSGGLGSALAGTLEKELPKAIAADDESRAMQRKAAGAVISEIDSAAQRRKETPRPTLPTPPPPPQFEATSPVQQWGSMAMGMAMLGSAFTKRPAINALNAAAGVMNAYHDRDAEAYKRNFDHWKATSDYSLKMYEYQREAYRDALSDIDKDVNGAMQKFRVVAEAFKDDKMAEFAKIGNAAAVIQTLKMSDFQYEEAKTKAEQLKQEGGLRQQWFDAQRAATANPTDPVAVANLQAATKALHDYHTAIKGGYSPTEAKDTRANALYDQFEREWHADPKNAGKEPTADKKAEWTAMAYGSAAGRSSAALSGTLSDESANLLADQFILGDTQAITSLPRSGPARVKVENRIAEKMREMPDAARHIAMNRMRMAEARSAATTGGRITMNTELFSQEARMAGSELERVSATVPRTKWPTVNQAIQAYERNTGDPKIIAFGVALNALRNAYGKMSNPTGTGIHDADKDAFERIMNTALSHGQIQSGVEQIVREGSIMSNAARHAQEEVLGQVVPHTPGSATTPLPAAGGAPAAVAPPPPSGKPTITNQKDYDDLPVGADYLDANGNPHTKRK